MSEIITTYKPEKLDVALPMERDEYYRWQIELSEKGEKPSLAAGIICILIFEENGEIFIQKRSDRKGHNSGLLDKTIGGHITFGDTVDYTVMVETVQELKVPSITLRSDEDFQKTYNLLAGYLDTVAIVKHIDTQPFEFKRKIKGKDVPILNKVHLYFGIYNGAVKTVDREAKGVLLYSLEDLEREMKEFPMIFTDDIKTLVKRYRPEIRQFTKTIKKK